MSDSGPPHRPAKVVVATTVAVISGGLVALQSRMNGQLGLELGDGFVAAFFSFASGLVILMVVMVFARSGRVGLGRVVTALRERRIPWWYLIGGSAGALFVLTQGLVIGVVGVALFTVGVVAGQLTSSLLIDSRGFGTSPPKRLTAARIVGAALALAGAALAVSGEIRTGVPFWMLAAPIVAGLVVGYQQAANGQVKAVSGSMVTATFLNFVVGTLALGVALAVHLLFVSWPSEFPSTPWVYLGGAVGVVFIAAQVAVVRTTGVLLLGLALLSGQLAAAVFFDVLLPVPEHPATVAGVVGAAITLLAVAIALVPRRVTASSDAPAR